MNVWGAKKPRSVNYTEGRRTQVRAGGEAQQPSGLLRLLKQWNTGPRADGRVALYESGTLHQLRSPKVFTVA